MKVCDSRAGEERKLAPIALFVYNRPWHTEQTLTALSNNILADQSCLFIFSDGPRPDLLSDDISSIDQVRQVIRKKKWCKEIIIIESEKNKGLADSITYGVTRLTNEFGKVIVIEDDIITSPGFLQFMNDALDVYEKNEKVMHISAYMYPHNEKLPDTFFFNVPYPGGGWATWQRAWKFYISDIEYLYNYFDTARGWWRFNKYGGDYLQRQLILNRTGELKTWFIKWHGSLLINNGFTLYPGHSLTTNIGFDGSGSNCPPMRKFDVSPLAKFVNVEPVLLRENKLANRLIFRFYQGSITFKVFIYRILIRYLKKNQVQRIKTLFFHKN